MSYIALATVTLGSTDSEIVFSSIPATYKDLVLVAQVKASSTVDNMNLRLNADTGSNYSYVIMRGLGSGSGSSSSESGQTFMRADLFGSGVETDFDNFYIIQIMDYSATDKHKTVLNRMNNSSQNTGAIAGRWASTTAVNQVSIFINSTTFAIGTTVSLYGVA
jgi:hypothetical protein